MLSSIEKNIEKDIIKHYKQSKEVSKTVDVTTLTKEDIDTMKKNYVQPVSDDSIYTLEDKLATTLDCFKLMKINESKSTEKVKYQFYHDSTLNMYEYTCAHKEKSSKEHLNCFKYNKISHINSRCFSQIENIFPY